MRVIVSLLHHFRMTPDGTVYPYSVFDYAFWQRYLEVFDEVIVFARVEDVGEVDPEKMPAKASGPGVTFVKLPEYQGAWEYAKIHPKIRAISKMILNGDDACVLRVPGYLSTMLQRQLKKRKRPYAIEVVGDPWQAFSPGSYPSLLRFLYRRLFTWEMKDQCRHATFAAYVTEHELQKRYPPGGWNTHYSSIDLPKEFIISQEAIEQRIERINQKVKTKGAWKLCFVGSMWHYAKSPDILIQAVALCIKKGYNIQLTMVGGGSLRMDLEKMVTNLGITGKVKFTGHLPSGPSIYKQLDDSDVFVLPSRSEGLPRSIIEAFARGLPAIGGHEGGFPELLTSQYMVPKIDVENMSQTIINVLSDVGGMKKIIKTNVMKAKEYQVEVLQKRRNELYSKLKDVTGDWLKNNKGQSLIWH